MEDILLYFSLKYKGDFDKIFHALESKESVDIDLKEELFKDIDCKYTTMVSNDYPEALKLISGPPFVLYYHGDLSLLDKETIGVVGMRIPSPYGKQVTETIVKDLVQADYTIVSGMALGIDAIAHKTALENNGKTVAVLGSGINYCYPKRNKDIYEEMKGNQLVVSEYPGEVEPSNDRFPQRNRIVAGLSKSILVTESQMQGEVMKTVGNAIEQGKKVYSVPGRITDYQGCNNLIKHGATVATSAESITGISLNHDMDIEDTAMEME